MSNILAALLYYFVLFPISLLPFRLLYGFSDIFCLVLFNVFGYRKNVIHRNIRQSFPEKSAAEIKNIEKEFYKHFCDIILETLKLFSVSQSTIEKRIEIVNSTLLNDYYDQGKSLVLVTGHYANWEWAAITLSLHSNHIGTGIYKKLSNGFFDKKLRQTRAKFGVLLMSTREVADFFENYKNKLCTYGFINDQSPSDPRKGHWMKFLNQETCMLTGAEKYAVKYDYPVLYGVIKKIKRGYYRVEYVKITDKPSSELPFAITEKCAIINEKLILDQPEYWLWTHRRWKHKKPISAGQLVS